MLDLFDSLTDERARVEKRVTVARQCLHVKLLIAYIFSHINIFFPTSYLFLYQNILSFRIFLVRIFYTLIFFNPKIFVPTSSLCIRWLHCKLIDCSVQTFPSLMWDLFKVHSIDPDTWDTCSIVRIVQLCAPQIVFWCRTYLCAATSQRVWNMCSTLCASHKLSFDIFVYVCQQRSLKTFQLQQTFISATVFTLTSLFFWLWTRVWNSLSDE